MTETNHFRDEAVRYERPALTIELRARTKETAGFCEVGSDGEREWSVYGPSTPLPPADGECHGARSEATGTSRRGLIAAALVTCLASPAFAQSGPGFTLDSRPDVTTITVPVVRPVDSNRAIAFDVMPNGSPTEVPYNGFAWVDVCDHDLVATPRAPTTCARLSIMSNGVWLKTMSFNGAPEKPLHLGSNSKLIATFTASPSPRMVVGDFDTNGAAKRLAGLEARAAALEAKIKRLTTMCGGDVP